MQAWRKVMAAYCRVYDSRHLHADCHEPGSAPEPYVGNRVWATFTFLIGNHLINDNCLTATTDLYYGQSLYIG